MIDQATINEILATTWRGLGQVMPVVAGVFGGVAFLVASILIPIRLEELGHYKASKLFALLELALALLLLSYMVGLMNG